MSDGRRCLSCRSIEQLGARRPAPTDPTPPHPTITTPPLFGLGHRDTTHRHLPERWGYAYFTEAGVNSTAAERRHHSGNVEEGPRDPLWPVKEALSQVYEAEKAYDALYGKKA